MVYQVYYGWSPYSWCPAYDHKPDQIMKQDQRHSIDYSPAASELPGTRYCREFDSLDAHHYWDAFQLPFTLLEISWWGSTTKILTYWWNFVRWLWGNKSHVREWRTWCWRIWMTEAALKETKNKVVQVLFEILGNWSSSRNFPKLRIIVNKTFLHPARPSWKFCLLSVLAAATFSTTKQSLSLSV